MAGTGNTSVRSYNFFVGGTIDATGAYNNNRFEFIDVDDQTPFLSHTMIFSNDGATTLSFRFTPDDGSGTAHGFVQAGETLQMDFKRVRRVFFAGAPALAYRFWAW